jgi:type IV pilus assembly protein PilE
MMNRHTDYGFTLIELMIVTAIIGILAVIAYPSFQQVIIRSDRADARRALLDVQLAQERFKSTNSDVLEQAATYSNSLANLGTAGLAPTLASGTSERGFYSLAITSADRGGFTATATALGRQTKDISVCQTFTLSVSLGGIAKTPSECW